ncbi:MAG: F420-nonreducing hydrogenase [Candidatus Freyrarchaeum guaymaensis]|nr:F420-nonreducing hydrogenase [Candidatus Sigynarchaeota archaeon]
MPVKIALAQLGSCWGCYQSFMDNYEGLLDILPELEIVFWHTVTDFKYKDLESYEDGSIDVGTIEGVCRTEEDLHILKLMRKKCKVLISLGSCSTYGGIYGLLNLYTMDEALKRKFIEAESVAEPAIPDEDVPKMLDFIVPNRKIVEFDAFLPGCPPTKEDIANALVGLLKGELPPPPKRTLCDECPREKSEVITIRQLKRDYEGIPDPDKCLLEQGYICMGPATREGCGALCPSAGVPCRGCYGPGPNVIDQGAKMISALGSIVDYEVISPEELVEKVGDAAGTFYNFFLPSGIISKTVRKAK